MAIRSFLFLVMLVLAAPVLQQDMACAAETSAQLEQVRKQRIELKGIREQLEARLGALGQELKTMDTALVAASAEAKQVQDAVKSADTRIASLNARQHDLQLKGERLKEHMQREAGLAYRQAGSSSMWLDMLFDAKVAEVPHRQHLLSLLVQRQQQDREEYARVRTALAVTQSELEQQRKELDALLVQKQERQHELQLAQSEKHGLWERVRKDAGLKDERDRQLARQEKALKKLLKGAASTLLNTDNMDDWKPMRQMKGRLPWPLDGRIVAAFHSPTAAGRPSLAGVQLAPRHGGGQVKAIAAGQVRYADWFGGYGLMMIIDHGDGLMSVYAHNDALYKRPGDWVAEGDVLADPGSTGWVQDKRLYFEVRDAGQPSNPLSWCRKKG